MHNLTRPYVPTQHDHLRTGLRKAFQQAVREAAVAVGPERDRLVTLALNHYDCYLELIDGKNETCAQFNLTKGSGFQIPDNLRSFFPWMNEDGQGGININNQKQEAPLGTLVDTRA